MQIIQLAETRERLHAKADQPRPDRLDPILVRKGLTRLKLRVGAYASQRYVVAFLAAAANERNLQAAVEHGVPIRQKIKRRILKTIHLEGIDLTHDQVGQRLAKAKVRPLPPGPLRCRCG